MTRVSAGVCLWLILTKQEYAQVKSVLAGGGGQTCWCNSNNSGDINTHKYVGGADSMVRCKEDARRKGDKEEQGQSAKVGYTPIMGYRVKACMCWFEAYEAPYITVLFRAFHHIIILMVTAASRLLTCDLAKWRSRPGKPVPLPSLNLRRRG